MREPRAYNQSIYLMVGMPYLLLGTVGFMIYRAKNRKPLDGALQEWARGAN